MFKITSILGFSSIAALLLGGLISAASAETTTVSGRAQVTTADAFGTNDVRVTQDNQVWITANVSLANTFYISGNGWNTSEQYGPLRFAGGNSATECAKIAGNVILEGNSRISTRNGTASCYGIISGNVSGDFTLEYNSMGATGAGVLILSGTNTYGATTISTGTLQIGNNGTTGTLGTGAVSIAANASLAFARTDDMTLTNAITGGSSATVTQKGPGTLTISGDASGFSGIYSTSNGVITWSNNTSISSVSTSGTGSFLWGSVTNVTGNVSIGSAMDYSTIFQTGVTFTNNPTLVSGGILDLKGASYAAATANMTLAGGKVIDSTGTSSIEINGSRTINASVDLPVFLATEGGTNTIVVDSGYNSKLTGVIANKEGFTSQKLVKSGEGTLTLSGASTYDGGTEVAQGTLALDRTNGGTLVGAVQIDSGATFQVNRSDTSMLLGNKISGSGTFLTVTPDGAAGAAKELSLNAAQLADLDGFTGTLAFQGQRVSVNWNDVLGRTLEVRDTAQFWIGNASTTISNNLIIAGNGWATNERRGAIRFQAAVNIKAADESDMGMTVLSGAVTLSNNARISAFGDSNLVYAMISGSISGNYTLDANTIGKTTNRLILTGSNTYGATTVTSGILQIGHVGKVNNVDYDGTTGTLGTGATTVSSGATLNFNRTNTYAYGASVTNNGTFNVNSGVFSMTAALSGSGTTNIAAGGTLQTDSIADVSNSQKIAGSGTWLIQTAGTSGMLTLSFDGYDLTGFTGTIAMQNWRTSGQINWASFSGKTIEVRDSAQLWMQNTIIGDFSDNTTNFRITGNGWKGTNNENRGAIRFNTYWDSAAPTAMQLLKANVEIVDAAKIMLFSDGKANHSALSGVISGGTLNASAELASNVFILLGENTYGVTNISNLILQVGHEGVINGTTYDGTTGTLGTGKVTVASGAVLDIHRDTYTMANEFENNGTFRISRGVTTLTSGISGSVEANITILKDAVLSVNPTADASITSLLRGDGTFEKTGSAALTLTSTSNSTTRFNGIIHVKEGTLNIQTSPSHQFGTADHPLGKEIQIDAGATVNLKSAHLLGWNGADLTIPVIAGTLDLLNDQFIGDVVMNGGFLKDTNNRTGHRVRGGISTVANSGTSTITAQFNFLTSGGSGENIKPFEATGLHTFDIAEGSTLDYQGKLAAWNVAGNVSIAKTGTGTLVLSNTGNTFAGALTIQGGTVEVNGNYAGAIAIEGGTLTGNGTISGAVTMNGGNSAIQATPMGKTGVLALTNEFDLNGTLLADIGGVTLGSYDQITTTGTLSITPGSSVALSLVGGYMPSDTDVGLTHWDLLVGQAGDLTDFDLSSLSLSAPALDIAGLSWALGISADGSTLYAMIGAPEPSSWILMLLGTLAFFGFRWKKNH